MCTGIIKLELKILREKHRGGLRMAFVDERSLNQKNKFERRLFIRIFVFFPFSSTF